MTRRTYITMAFVLTGTIFCGLLGYTAEKNYSFGLISLANYSVMAGYNASLAVVKNFGSAARSQNTTDNCLDYHRESRERLNVNILGVEIDQLKSRMIEPQSPLTFLKDYKNPCWLEKLPPTFEQDYKKNLFYTIYGKKLKTLFPEFQKRLSSDTPWRMRCLPYVYLVGVTKSGTTDMYNTIASHPDVYTPWVKEYMYWNKRRYPKGAKSHEGRKFGHANFESYAAQFDYPAHLINVSVVNTSCGRKHEGITLDGSSYYFWEDNGWDQNPDNVGLTEPQETVAHDIAMATPEARVIVLMRNPTSRVHSAFAMYVRESALHWKKGRSARDFDIYVRDAIRQYKDCFKLHGIRACAYNATLSYKLHPISLRASMYPVFLKDWWKSFDRDRLLIIRSEDYYGDRNMVFTTVRNFLGLRTVNDDLRKKIKAKKPALKRKYQPMFKSTKAILDEFFRPFTKELEQLLGRTMWS